MNRIINILVFPGGTEIGMEIYKSLVNCKFVKLFSVSSKETNHASYIFTNHFVISDIYSAGWIDELNEIIVKEKIDFVFPAHAFVIDALAEHRLRIKAEIMLCDSEVLRLTRSKSKTYRLFENDIDTPTVFHSLEEVESLPVFIKPDNYYGSQGAERIDNLNYLEEIFDKKQNYIVCEYLDGEEYTIDCFSDADGKIIFCEGRIRDRIRMGTSMHSEGVSGELAKFFLSISKTITKKIKITGPWFFQMKRDGKGKLKLLEIEPRIAGTMAYHRVKGINFPLLYLYTLLGYRIDTLTNDLPYILDRALVNRYKHNIEYDTVYIDLDDTIVVHDKLNLDAIKFLYQCVNKSKKIILISKSLKENKNKFLKEWKIDGLFDEKIWLTEEDSKVNYMNKGERSIFIDDSFAQRKEVAEKMKIPTFDPSMIELLLDERL